MFLMVDTSEVLQWSFHQRGERANCFQDGYEGIKHNVVPEVVKDQSQ